MEIKFGLPRSLQNQFKKLAKKNFLKNLKQKIRGYNKLKNKNQIGIFRDIKGKCTEISFEQIRKSTNRFLFGAAFLQAEQANIQYLLQNLFIYDFDKKVISFFGKGKGKLVYPLPKAYADVLRAYGISIASFRSKINWGFWIVRQWLYGILVIFKILYDSLESLLTMSNKNKFEPDSAYFHGLRSSNLPQSSPKSYDILTWYIQKFKGNSIKVCYHTVKATPDISLLDKKVTFIGKNIYIINSWYKLVTFVFWVSLAIPLTFWNLLLGRWWNVILLGDFALSRIFRKKEVEEVSKEYLFHFSLNIFRPLWTYEVESKGAKVISYFYAGYEHVKLPEGYADQRWEFGRTNWPEFYVWDEWQKELVRRELLTPKSEFKVVGPIWFETSTKTISLPKRCISVFDYQQHRKAFHLGVSPSSVFFNAHPDVNIRFLKDIQEVLYENEIFLVFKKKRDIGKRAETRYTNFMKKLERLENVVLADPEIPALYLIENSMGTISLPFTSTALFRRDENFPSIYYDPTGWVDPTDRASHDIPVIQGKASLTNWVFENFDKQLNLMAKEK
jgi:polysaccharide biosynthesis PFTS motif protein